MPLYALGHALHKKRNRGRGRSPRPLFLFITDCRSAERAAARSADLYAHSFYADSAPDLHVIRAGSELWRIYMRGGNHPRAWNAFRAYGPVKTMRFDHHREPAREQERAILYGAARIPICIAEFFQRARMIDRHRGEPWLVGFTITRDVALLNPRGTWPTRAGALMAINTGRHDRTRRWSQAIHASYPDVEGLWYSSSMYANQPAFAFYERAETALSQTPFFHMPLSAPGLYAPLDGIAREIGYGFL